MKTYLILTLAALLVGCSTPTPPSENIPLPPVASEQSVSPTIKTAKGQNLEVQGKLNEQATTIQVQGESLQRATEIATRLQDQINRGELVRKEDVEALRVELDAIKRDNNTLLKTNRELIQKVAALQALLDEADSLSTKKDKQVESLEAQNQHYRIREASLISEKNSAIQERDKLTKTAADAKVYKKILWTAAIGYLVLLIVKNILAYSFPTMNILKRF